MNSILLDMRRFTFIINGLLRLMVVMRMQYIDIQGFDGDLVGEIRGDGERGSNGREHCP